MFIGEKNLMTREKIGLNFIFNFYDLVEMVEERQEKDKFLNFILY